MDQVINNIVVSSRVRLARNLEGLPFKTKTKGVFDGVAGTIRARNPGFVSTALVDLAPDMARALFEQHIISRELLPNKSNAIIVASQDNKVIIMLGEEDHIRIQTLQSGLNLKKAFDMSKKIADDIENEHEIAHRPEFGYLTSCPTNLGTGMRASVMMFLPALTITNRLNAAIKRLKPGTVAHITVRGMYGEGSAAGGYMYQISNQACFGMTEQEILKMVEGVTMHFANEEFHAQKLMYASDADGLVDQCFRAWGILTNAYMISSAEAMELLAVLKLGACLGIIKFKSGSMIDDLFFVLQPSTMVTVNQRAGDTAARDKMRAAQIAKQLTASRVM